MKFVKKSAFVDATQWQKPGDHPEVELAHHMLHLSADGKFYYITYGSAPCHHWLTLDKEYKKPHHTELEWMSQGLEIITKAGTYYRRLLPFQFFSINSSRLAQPIPPTDDTVIDYAMSMDWGNEPQGRLVSKRIDRTVVCRDIPVFPGDWIVDDGMTLSVVVASEFSRQYCPA